MRLKLFAVLFLFAGIFSNDILANSTDATSVSAESQMGVLIGKGGEKKEKKNKNDAYKNARKKAKDVKYNYKLKEATIMQLAKIRLFFHRTFNTKVGKPVDFRKSRNRNRWNKGKMS